MMKVHTSEDMAQPTDAQSLADRLQRALLPGAGLAMAWRASGSGDSGLSVLDASESGIALARQLLDAAGATPASNGRLSTSWALADGTRVAVVGEPTGPVPEDVRRDWPRLVRDLATAWLELRRAQARVVALQKSEQLQQALYEIGDLAGSDLDMADMLRRIHAIVGANGAGKSTILKLLSKHFGWHQIFLGTPYLSAKLGTFEFKSSLTPLSSNHQINNNPNIFVLGNGSSLSIELID